MAIPISRQLDFNEIPQIDAGPLLAGQGANSVDALRRACEEVGFFYVLCGWLLHCKDEFVYRASCQYSRVSGLFAR